MIATTVIQRTPTLRWSVAGKDYEYLLTETDVLDLTRSAWREGEPVAGVIHTLIQRYVATYPKKAWPSLSLFLRDYVQPINPKWFTTGELHGIEANRLSGEAKKKSIERAQRREQYARTPLHRIPARYRQIVQAVLVGTIRTPNAQAQHFVASQATASMNDEEAKKRADIYGRHKKLGEVLDVSVGFGPKVNWFYRGKRAVPTIALSMQATKRGQVLTLVTVALLGYLTSQLL